MHAPDADALAEPAIELAASWLRRSRAVESRADRATMTTLRDLVSDERGVDFVMRFVDRVARPDDDAVAAAQLESLVRSSALPDFLSVVDKALLRLGGRLAPTLPAVVMPLARRRMRSVVGHLVAPAEADRLRQHLATLRRHGYELNVNLLGEAVLGHAQATSRLERLIELLHQPEVDYVSVKISSIVSQLNHWDYEGSLARVMEQASRLLDAAADVSPATFVNFDMEEYRDLHLTIDAFESLLVDPGREGLDVGIVLQAYLPDVFDILRALVTWANDRHARGGGTVKIRLVKGANLAMEKVEAAMHGWEQAPYTTKIEADANYRRCIDWVLDESRLTGVRIGLASHNLFDVAWTKLLATERGVARRVQFEMLQGMAPGQTKAVAEASPDTPVLLYTPAVAKDDFDVAIGYLFRRLEENSASDNFMRALFDLEPDSPSFRAQADFFREGLALRHEAAGTPRRQQDRRRPDAAWQPDQGFANHPDTDPTLPANRDWIHTVVSLPASPCRTPITTTIEQLDATLARAGHAGISWAKHPPSDRRAILHRVGDELSHRRAELMATMMHEASKPIAEADVEVSEAIDFAHWYGERTTELVAVRGAEFTPFGIVGVIPPWNFPVAIPAGGVLASLAAGNSVILKPAPETPRCAEVVAEACWAAGVPRDVLQFVRTPDDHVGRHLVESVDVVILTGSTETAGLFRSWRPRLRLFAETSGKNAMIVTPSADLDLAANDVIRSAFGHAGQKCSAASLAILVGDVYDSERFRRQLVDAATTLTVGPATRLDTDIAPLVAGGNPRLTRGATTLADGEIWLLSPIIDGDRMTPGIRDRVRPGSWFHTTECFGPILGLMHARTLEDAIEIANSSDFGLTGGLQSLDPDEVATWMEQIQVGNGYVNRPITGAIVRRQPFGGWKKSSVGPGAKAGGPNYVMQLGRWSASDQVDDYGEVWNQHFAIEHDSAALECEANIFRYRPLPAIGLRIGPDARVDELDLTHKAASVAGVQVVPSSAAEEPDVDFIERLARGGIERVRLVGTTMSDELATGAARHNIHLIDAPVTPAGRVELLHYVREQAMSVTLHRFGNLTSDLVQRG